MYNWNKVFSDGQFDFIKKKPELKASPKHIQGAMDALLDDYIQHYGLNRQYKSMLELQKRAAKLKLQYIKKKLDDMLALQLVDRITQLEREIERTKKLLMSGSPKDFDRMVVMIQKWYGQKIDLKNTTVKEFNSIKESYVAAHQKR